jgi:hypothetical protein
MRVSVKQCPQCLLVFYEGLGKEPTSNDEIMEYEKRDRRNTSTCATSKDLMDTIEYAEAERYFLRRNNIL